MGELQKNNNSNQKFKLHKNNNKFGFQRSKDRNGLKNTAFGNDQKRKYSNGSDKKKSFFNKFKPKKQVDPREDKGGFKQYANKYQNDGNKQSDSQQQHHKGQEKVSNLLNSHQNKPFQKIFNNNLKNKNHQYQLQRQNYRGPNQNNKPLEHQLGQHQDQKSRVKQSSGPNSNYKEKKRHPDDVLSSDEEEIEQPKVHYVLAPDLLDKKIQEVEVYQVNQKKLNKREEYLQKKKRKEEIYGQKTRKGQPVMAGRMQLLYEKIKNSEA